MSDLSEEEALSSARSPAHCRPRRAATRGSRPAPSGAEALEDGHAFGDEEVWYVADAIPPGRGGDRADRAPLGDPVPGRRRSGRNALADEWIHPKDLLAVGALARRAAASTS